MVSCVNGWAAYYGTATSNGTTFYVRYWQDTTGEYGTVNAWCGMITNRGFRYTQNNYAPGGTTATEISYQFWERNEGNSYSGDVKVPATVTIGGHSVKIVAIGPYAFANCWKGHNTANNYKVGGGFCEIATTYAPTKPETTYLNSIDLSGATNLQDIDNYAFWGYKSTNITITIPASVKSIGRNPFAYTIGNGTSDNTDNEPKITIKVASGNPYFRAKDNCLYTIPDEDGKTTIVGVCGDFEWPHIATSSAADTEVKEIVLGRYSLAYCLPKTTINIPGNDGDAAKVTEMMEGVFCGTNTLETVTIPKSVKTMGNGVFRELAELTSVTFDEDINTTFGKSMFYKCSKLPSITLPACVTVLPSPEDSSDTGTFEGCTSLASVTLNGDVTTIGNKSFYNCSALPEITLPSTVETIGQYAFYGTSALESFTLPISTYLLSAYSFRNSGIKTFIIPFGSAMKDVTASSDNGIKGSAFMDCSNLADIYCYLDTPPVIAETSFSGMSSSSVLHVPANGLYNYKDFYADYYATYGSTPYGKTYYRYWGTSATNKFGSWQGMIPDGAANSWTGAALAYTGDHDVSSVGMRYIRSFSGTGWQALCLPFAFKYDDVKDNFEVATLRSTQNSKGYLQFDIRSSGDVAAHTPCLIRAKNSGNAQYLETTSTSLGKASDLSPVTLNLFVAVEGVTTPDPCNAEDWEKQDCPIGGLYAPATRVTNGWAMSGGVIKRVGSSASVPAFRWILTTPGGRLVRELTISEDDGTETRLDALTLEPVATGNGALYNLKGQRVVAPHHGEIYIRNGRKVIY